MEEKDKQKQAVLLAFVAGIIDGEGCISIHRNKGRGQFYVRISVGMAHENTIKLLQETFGGKIGRNERSKYPNAQQIYRWQLSAQAEVRNFLNLVSPYIRVKTRQLHLAIAWLDDVKKRDCRKKPEKLTDTEIQRREDMFQLMHKFNGVGAAATTNWENT